jgi:orotidine-5'-phosphate decarboxylase
MNHDQLFEQIRKKKSFLCVGLDKKKKKIPAHLLDCDDPQFEFNKMIVDATHHLAIAYKPNLAFYEAEGSKGWVSFEKTVRYIKATYPEIFIIADAKRGDILNTSSLYARAFFETLPCDAMTVAPYMGEDSVSPFLEYPGKWVILLALTSNKGAQDFQWYGAHDGGGWKDRNPLFWEVLQKSKTWANEHNMMYVVGATKSEYLTKIRTTVPNHFLLVPGVGAQGGSLAEVAEYGMNNSCGLIVNSSREIIFASKEKDFAEIAAKVAKEKYQQPMEALLREKGLL